MCSAVLFLLTVAPSVQAADQSASGLQNQATRLKQKADQALSDALSLGPAECAAGQGRLDEP